MHIKRYFITLILLLFAVNVMHSQNVATEINSQFSVGEDCLYVDTLQNNIRINKHRLHIDVHFKFDNYDLMLDYMGNRTSLQKLAHKIDSIGISNIDSIVIVSQSSPEGVYEHNLTLSKNRANTMHKYILDKHPELIGRIFVNQEGESWAQLREHVKNDALMKNATKEKVISIIDADESVRIKKQRMAQLLVYRYLLQTYYPRIRNTVYSIFYHSEIISMKGPEPMTPIAEFENAEVSQDICTNVDICIPETEEWTRRLHLKTNVMGLGMAIVNVGAEVDLLRHWSFTLPVYFSAWDYFKSTIKFRTFAVQPEFRYWPSEQNDGFFTGAHIGLAYYNFAFDGDFRCQDHGGETPAIGGGVSIGYRLPVSKNNRWKIEFSLGVGVYPIHYDKFHNTPYFKDGMMAGSIKTTYWGIDQLAVSIAYSFDQKKKGSKL